MIYLQSVVSAVTMASLKVQSRFALLSVEDDSDDNSNKSSQNKTNANNQKSAQKKKSKKKKQQQIEFENKQVQ